MPQQTKVTKKVSANEKHKQVSLPEPKYSASAIFMPKFIAKDGQPLLNSNSPLLNPKTACNLIYYIFTDFELTILLKKSDVNLEDS